MLSQTHEYALRAMAFLAAAPDRPHPGAKIAEGAQLPKGYVFQVMERLRKAGLVNAQRGPSGGFSLARSLDAITLLDVANAVEPLPRIEKCPLGNPAHVQLCPLHRRLDDAVAHIENTFAGITFAQLVSEIRENDQRCQFPMPPKP